MRAVSVIAGSLQMPYNTVVAPSSIFPERPDHWPPAWVTESRASFVPHKLPPPTPQRYRGSKGVTSVLHEQPITRHGGPIVLAQLQSLHERLKRLHKQLEEEPGNMAENSQATLDAVSAQLATLGNSTAGATEGSEAFLRKKKGTGSFDSFAQFASEASRVRSAGRLPFGSDHTKIRLT
ncbi:hypothetical protein AB1Y20_019125 [Prymnesium parvum]|uniref:Uncharacterized protein n=1 Tax=Prymnesium parvum TaxID=97485 RepID=A0AB34JT48_PRYPA